MSSCTPFPVAPHDVRLCPALLFQSGTNLSGKLLRRLFLSSVKDDRDSWARSGGDVRQLSMAC